MSLLVRLAVRLQAESGPAVTLVDEDRNAMLHDPKTLARTVRAMRPIVPARDFDISERFYVDHALMVLLRLPPWWRGRGSRRGLPPHAPGVAQVSGPGGPAGFGSPWANDRSGWRARGW